MALHEPWMFRFVLWESEAHHSAGRWNMVLFGPLTQDPNCLRGVWDLGCIEGSGFVSGSDFEHFTSLGLVFFWGSTALNWFRVKGPVSI